MEFYRKKKAKLVHLARCMRSRDWSSGDDTEALLSEKFEPEHLDHTEGLPFRFLDLPPELRNQVYSQCK